jgi:hypothetical protein
VCLRRRGAVGLVRVSRWQVAWRRAASLPPANLTPLDANPRLASGHLRDGQGIRAWVHPVANCRRNPETPLELGEATIWATSGAVVPLHAGSARPLRPLLPRTAR